MSDSISLEEMSGFFNAVMGRVAVEAAESDIGELVRNDGDSADVLLSTGATVRGVTVPDWAVNIPGDAEIWVSLDRVGPGWTLGGLASHKSG